MTEYVLVKYKFQVQICKTEPTIIGVYKSLEIAEKICKRLHRDEWQRIVKEGIKNDTFSYYSDKIKASGYNFNENASEEEIQNLVEFIETGEVADPYVGNTNLKPLRIVELEKITARIENISETRYLIKEDYLYDTGEIYMNSENNKYGNPIFVTDAFEVAKSKFDELEYNYFVDKVLGHNPRMNLQTSRYWKDVMYLEENKLDEIEFKLVEKGISLNSPKNIENVIQIRETLKEVVGIGVIDNFFSIDTFQIGK